MRLLSLQHGEIRLTEYVTKDCPPYAVLSHRWLEDAKEVTFREMTEGSEKSRLKEGYRKIEFCKERAAHDGIRHFWVDTCGIDKTNNTELSEAINSMFLWYQRSQKCYVYMADITINGYEPNKEYPQSSWEPDFRKSNWFTRGWTLQELIAPPSVEFFTANGYRLGDKASLEGLIHEITGIAISALRGTPLSEFSVNERMSWIDKRQTKREEDMAYSLFGIFDIYLPLIYGEGQQRALTRVRREIADLERHKSRTASEGKFPLQKAAKDGDARLLKKYLRPGSSLNVYDMDEHDRTALHYAKTARIVEILVDAGASVNQEDYHGQTPLHRAAVERRLEVVKELLSKTARTTKADINGKIPLNLAQDCPAATWMLENGSRANGLFHMAWLGDIEGVAFFLSQGSDVNKRDSDGETALTYASRQGDIEIVKLLLDASADTEVKTKDGSWSPLLLAVSNNREDVVEMLIKAGARLHTTDDRNHDALAEAVNKGHWDIARLLIKHGGRIDTADHRGNTPLHCSGHRADPEFTKFLVDNGANVNAQNLIGGTPLLECIAHSIHAKDQVKILLGSGANPTISNHWGYSPLSEAARVGEEEVMKLLLKVVPNPSLASNPSLPGASSWTPLAEACFNAKQGCVRLLLDAGVNTELRNAEWYTALHQAVRTEESSAEIVRMLVGRGASLEAKDKNDETPLAIAAKYSNGDVVQALLDAGANTHTCSCSDINKEENGYNPLLLAVEAENEGAVQALVKAGVNLDAQTANRKLTALQLAEQMDNWDLVSLLIDGGANVNLCDAENQTPLMEAARAGKLEIARKLIDAGADRRLRDKRGRTAWVWAKHYGHGKEFDLLKPSAPEISS